MYRRQWTSLPKDPQFPHDLAKLGYFINKEDEIRNAKSPNLYFKFRINKNERVNSRQRYAFNAAIRDVVHSRLESEGLEKILLPLGVKDTSEPHLPIFASMNLKNKSRVVVFFGEHLQDLGNLALRVINGKGGINMGSMVSVVQQLERQVASKDDPEPPGIIIANPAELWWCPEEKRPLTMHGKMDLAAESMVHSARASGPENDILHNECISDHFRYVLQQVIPALTDKKTRFDFIAVGMSADELVYRFDDGDFFEKHFLPRTNTISLIGSIVAAAELQSQAFRNFIAKRARAYVCCEAPKGTVISGPEGNENTSIFTNQGTAAVLSSGESYLTECIMITAQEMILEWTEQVAKRGVKKYRHPKPKVVYRDSMWLSLEDSPPQLNPDGTPAENRLRAKDEFYQFDRAIIGKLAEETGCPFSTEKIKYDDERDSEGRYPRETDSRMECRLVTSKAVEVAILRFKETGNFIDPREMERIEAEAQDKEDGIEGTY